MAEFFDMGGFGFYVWSSMAMVAFLMILEPLLLMMKRRSLLNRMRREKELGQLD